MHHLGCRRRRLLTAFGGGRGNPLPRIAGVRTGYDIVEANFRARIKTKK